MDENVIGSSDSGLISPVPKKTYKMIALRGVVVFPGQSTHFDLVRDKSIASLNRALELNQEIFLVAQRHKSVANPGPKDIYRVGVLARIKQVLKLPNDSMRVLVSGDKKMEIESYVSIAPYFEVTLKPYEDEPDSEFMLEAVKRNLITQMEEFKRLDSKLLSDTALYIDSPEKFIADMAGHIYKHTDDKQRLLQCKSVAEAYEDVFARLTEECEIKALEKRVSAKVRESIDKNQKEYYVREQIKALKEEIGDGTDELNEYTERAEKAGLPDYVLAKVKKEISRMEKMSPTSPEAGVSRTYIDWILDLPWHQATEDNCDLIKARKILDEDHYGLEKVKDRIVEYLAVHSLTSSLRGPILCFVGPPGVGKTSIVASIARAIGRKLVSMSLGGVKDEAEIRGHRRTYIGALPGRIINGIKNAGVVNPVFLLDEIDKMSSDFRGDPASAMLEVLDPNQNDKFVDHYLEMPYDLSKVMFVTTANSVETIPAPLLDRMELIELTGYTYEEKLQIAKKYLLPKQLEFNGLSEIKVNASDAVLMKVISQYTRESGVRNLEREIASIARKLAVKTVNAGKDRPTAYKVTKADVEEYLGVPKYREDTLNATDEVGFATGLAWTSVGGVTLNIEVSVIPDGKGEIKLTGSLGDVMKESCMTALSLVRSRAALYGIDKDAFSKNDIHIHFPEGATPKDGPSAGITITTAILSALSGKKISRFVAMTGEVTLRGKVLAIGGLKEKSLAAFRSGIKKLLIPEKNKKDASELPKEVTENVELIFVRDIDEVFANAFVD